MRKSLTAAAAAIAAFTLTIAPVASAADVAVRFADLDLSTEAGRAELDTRIEKAARITCTSQLKTGTILLNRLSQRCVAETRRQISQQIAARAARNNLGG
jgi:UrcA family protein